MTQDFTSVIAFYNALKNYLTDTVGLTVERTLASRDLILTDGAAVHLRVTHSVVSPTVSAICLRLGVDADALEFSSEDAACCLPFNTTDPASFSVDLSWDGESKNFNFVIYPGEAATVTDGQYRRYRVEFAFASLTRIIIHSDHTRPQYQPNFGETGGPYIESGA